VRKSYRKCKFALEILICWVVVFFYWETIKSMLHNTAYCLMGLYISLFLLSKLEPKLLFSFPVRCFVSPTLTRGSVLEVEPPLRPPNNVSPRTSEAVHVKSEWISCVCLGRWSELRSCRHVECRVSSFPSLQSDINKPRNGTCQVL